MIERVKQHESRFKKSHAGTATKDQVKEWRHALAQKWLFYPAGAPSSSFPVPARPFTVKAFLCSVLLTNMKGSVKDESRKMSNLQRL